MTSTHFHIQKKNLNFPYALLDGGEHHHLSRVLRIKPGKKVWLHDEEGRSYLAEVKEVTDKGTTMLILGQQGVDGAKIHLILAQALIRAKKMDFLVQKATEMGMDSLIPIVGTRSVVKISCEVEKKKVLRWQKIAAEAAKQSGRSTVPVILPPQPVLRLVEESKAERKLLLSENRGRYLKDILVEGPAISSDEGTPSVLILVGPEGGWTEGEENKALDRGFEAVSLGKQILRSETAALAALALVSHFWNA